MKIIETLSEKISDEIHDAKSYTHLALEQKDLNQDLARTLFGIGQEEMDHMSRLHNAVVAIIETYRKENGPPPAGMMALYEYLHRKQIEDAAEVKTLQNMYKES